MFDVYLYMQGVQSNGIFEVCAKEPLLSSWETNGGSKDVHIMENPQVLLLTLTSLDRDLWKILIFIYNYVKKICK